MGRHAIRKPVSLSPANSPARSIRRLRRSDLPVDTVKLARYLIGKTLVHDLPQGRLSGRIVETEAYVVGDAAAHAFRGQTPRNRSLFLERGRAYVYFVYGCWHMLNVSSERPGIGAGVLLRALEPLEGIERSNGCGITAAGRATSATSPGVPGVWPRRCGLTAATMAWTYARTGRCGWALRSDAPGQSQGARASGCRAKRIACCVFTSAAIPS